MGRDAAITVDLLEEIRAALDSVDHVLGGRVVDIEMARLQVVTDPALFQRVFAALITASVAQSDPPNGITVRVSRSGKNARIDVINENGLAVRQGIEHVTTEAEDFRSIGGDIGTAGPTDAGIYWMSVPAVSGSAHAADG